MVSRRKLISARAYCLLTTAGLFTAYVHSTIAQYRNAAPCGELHGFAGLLQSVGLIDNLGDCITYHNPATGQAYCDTQARCSLASGDPAHCILDNAGQMCVCVPYPRGLSIAKTHSGNFFQGQTGAQYTITVSNDGSPSTGTVSVSDEVPAGLTATGIAGTNWTCSQPAGPCSRSDSLATNASYESITLTVDVAADAPSSVTNRATLSGSNVVNDTAQDQTTINSYLSVQPGPTFTVTNLSDNNDGNCTVGDCSLREALDAANADSNPNTIEFSPGLTGTIHITTFNPFIDSAFVVSAPVAILGPGARFVAISGESSSHVFVVNSQDVSISDLTMTNGRPNNANGGAVLNQGSLTMTACTISNSSSTGSSGGNGGGLYNSANATATLTGCTFYANTAYQFGGGGVFNAGHLTATNCTFTDNSAPSGGGILSVANGNSLTTLRNCTITNNTATFTGSSTAGGGGYYGEGAVGNSLHHFSNTILAGNHNAVNPDLRGYGTSEGNNLIGNLGAAGSGFSNGVNGDKVGVSAQFGSLGNFGGPTNTWSLLAVSPAINAGNDALAPLTDQRGFPRLAASDIGAFEFGSVGLRITRFVLPGNDVVIQFTNAVAGSVYRLERKFQLTQPLWDPDPGFPEFTATANGEYAIDYAGGRVSHMPPIFYHITLVR